MSSSLTKKQKTTLIYIIGFFASAALSVLMIYNLNSSRASLSKLKQNVEEKESRAQASRPATSDELSQWTQSEQQLNDLLLPEQQAPEFFAEITKIASDTQVQGLGINTEEILADASRSPEDAKILAVGVHKYLAVTMKFRGQYADVARFLGSVSQLSRPLEYRVVEMKRVFPVVDVQLVLNVYKRDAA